MVKICKRCGKLFDAFRSNQKYCGERCRRAARDTRAVQNFETLKKCEHCGKFFEPFRSNQKYCSSKCCHKANTFLKPKILKKCEHCGKAFKTALAEKKYCSFECREKAIREQYRKPTVKIGRKICKGCGQEFEPVRAQQKYCNVQCREEYYLKTHRLQREVQCAASVTRTSESEQRQKLTLDDWIKRAAVAGMSYGKYRALIEQGRC